MVTGPSHWLPLAFVRKYDGPSVKRLTLDRLFPGDQFVPMAVDGTDRHRHNRGQVTND